MTRVTDPKSSYWATPLMVIVAEARVGSLRTRVTAALWLTPWLVPTTVRAELSGGVAGETGMGRTGEGGSGTGVTLKLELAPGGTPKTSKLTLPPLPESVEDTAETV